MAKCNVYYIGKRQGTSKKTNKPYKAVDLLTYNDRFESWGITPFFVDGFPKLCDILKSGDLVEIDVSQHLVGAAILNDITKKLADSPLKKG